MSQIEDPTVLRRFHEAGSTAFEAALVYSGLRPVDWSFFGRRLPVNITRAWIRSPRLLARTHEGVELWSCYTGPTPIRRLDVLRPADVLLRDRGGRWLELQLRQSQVWICRDDLSILDPLRPQTTRATRTTFPSPPAS